jgi:glycosyltransferase involved in cell wall biosynthesis
MRASVILCTHNRANRLAAAVKSAIDQDENPDTFEILVIDNASTDATRSISESFGSRVRYVHEPRLGLAHARNTGWRHARGEIAAYLDDDAVADAGWLRAILAAFDRARSPGCAGGPVRPLWEAPRPPWLADELLTSLTILDWPGGPHAIADLRTEWLAGANLAVPRALLEMIGGFAQGLDRSGTRLLSSGDVYMQKQIAARGCILWYDPAIAVTHAVPVNRLTRAWFRERYWAQGLSDAMMQILEEDLRGHPLRRARAAVGEAARLLARPHDVKTLIHTGEGAAEFRDHCFARIRLGHVAGLAGAV